MAEVEWIKIVTGFFGDDKIELIEAMPEADMILIIWIKLLCLAGKKNQGGYIFLTEKIPYTDEMLATIFKRPLNTIRLALATFEKMEMIDIDTTGGEIEKAGIIKITNWEKHQNIEGMERIRELGRKRIKKFRDKSKLITGPKTGSNVTETFRNGTDKIRLDKIRLDKKDSKEDLQNLISKAQREEPIEFDRELLSWHGITENDIESWGNQYPDINIGEELMKIRDYFKENPGPAKDIEERFEGKFDLYINAWLERADGYRLADSL